MSAAGIPGDQPEFDALIVNTIQLADNLGFGKSISLLFTIPFVMLFSYSKTHNNPQVDKFIPLAGIGLIVLIYIEGIFEIFIGKAGELFNTNEEVLLEKAQYMIDSVSRTIKRIINK